MGDNNALQDKELNYLMITANVGTLFENPAGIEDVWLNELSDILKKYEPHFIGLHCQEIGGKDYKSSVEPVKVFFKKFINCEWLKEYNIARGYLDGDFDLVDQYTALGNLYFVHNSVKEALLYNFEDEKFGKVSGKEIYFKNICSIPDLRKEKFEQDFFPDCKWSRKGYLRVRWKINGKVLEFVNIHLFHDDSNLVTLKSSPSLYTGYRKRALKFVLKRLKEQYPIGNGVSFLCGDFNFRLDSKLLIKNVCLPSREQVVRSPDDEEEVIRVIYRGEQEENGAPDANVVKNGEHKDSKVIAKVEKKFFFVDPALFNPFSSFKCLRSFDNELLSVEENLKEFDISFPPTYPVSEDIENPNTYMSTRCPSWCDRILLPESAWEWLHSEKSSKAVYDIVGGSVCMGDHKPVYLAFTATCDSEESADEATPDAASTVNGSTSQP